MSESDLLKALRRGGVVDSTGFFTVDKSKAQDKMREFQLVDPHDYVLNLVQAGVALGATGIGIQVDATHVDVVLAGVVLPRDLLEQPFAALFINQENRPLEGFRELAIGLNAVLALRPREFRVESDRFSIRLDRGDAIPISPRPPGSDPADTRVVVAGRWSWKLETLKALVAPEKSVPEAIAVRERAGFCPVPLTLNAVLLHTDSPGSFKFQGQSSRIWLWDPSLLRTQARSFFRFVKNGVLICSRPLDAGTLRVDGLVWADGLLKNASSTDIVEDARYREVLVDVEAACGDYVDSVCAAFAQNRTEELRLDLVDMLGARANRLTPRMAGTPVFYLLNGQLASFADLHQVVKNAKRLHYLDEAFFGIAPDDLTVVHLRGPRELHALTQLFGKAVRPVGDELQRAVRRQANVNRWKTSQHAMALPAVPYLVVVPFDVDRFTGEVGLLKLPDIPPNVTFFKERRRLADRTLDSALSYQAWINHDGFTPSFLWDDVQPDDLFDRALRVVGSQSREACRRVAESVRPPHPDAAVVRQVLRPWLVREVESGAETLSSLPTALKEVPLFPTVSTRLASLADLERDASEFGCVHYVVGLEPGPQRDHRQIVLGQAALLKKAFRSVRDYTRDLKAERRALAHVEGPTQLPSLSGEALYPVSFQAGSVSGVVGLALNRPFRAGPAGRKPSTVRLLLAGKPLETRTVMLEFGPLEATLDDPDLTPTPAFDAAVDDEHLAAALDVLRQGCGALAMEVAAHYGDSQDWKQGAIRDFLLDYMAWKQDDLPAELLDLPLWPQLAGPPLSVRAVRNLPTVPYVGEAGHRKPSKLPGVVLVAPAADVSRLNSLVPPGVPRKWEAELRQHLARDDFYDRPSTGLLLPPPQTDYVHVVEVEGPVVQARVGLLPLTADFKGQSLMSVVLDGRDIDSALMTTCIPILAVATATHLTPTSGFDGVARDAAFAAMREQVMGCIERGVDALLERAIAPHSRDSQVLLRWAMAQVEKASGLVRDVTGRLEQVALLPLLDDSRGQALSLREVALQFMQRQKFYWVSERESGQPADGDLRLARVSAVELACMKRVFKGAVDYSRTLAEEEGVRRRRAGARASARTTEDRPVLARLAVLEEGLRGELAISADDSRGVGLVVEDALVQTRPLFGELPVIGMLSASDFKANRQWTAVSVPAARVRQVDEALDRLYALLSQDVADRFTLLAQYFHHRHDRLVSGRYPEAARVPLFDTWAGGEVSLADLLQIRAKGGTVFYTRNRAPEATAGLCLRLSTAARDLLEEMLGAGLVHAEAPSQLSLHARTVMQSVTGALESARQSTGQVVDALAEGLNAVAGAEQRVAALVEGPTRRAREVLTGSWRTLAGDAQGLGRRLTSSLRRPDRRPDRAAATALLEQLQACLRSLPRRREVGMTDPFINRIQLFEPDVWRQDLRQLSFELVVVRPETSTVLLNVRHPIFGRLVQSARERRYPPGVVALLASTLLTALRQHEKSVTDARERSFLGDLAEWVAESS